MNDRSLAINDRRFHYTDWGDPLRPAVVFLHGITGHARSWDDEARTLSGRYHVLALDQRGHGDSDPAPDGDYTVATMAGDLHGFVGGLGLPRVSLVGLSMGGRVAIAYAAAHPGSVQHLVVVDIGPDIAPAGRARVVTMMADSPERFASADEVFASARRANPRYRESLLRARIRHAVRPLPDGGVTWKYDRALREMMRRGGGVETTDLWAAWGAITCPILVVRGVESDILTGDMAKQMLDANPRARLVEVAGAGHTVPGDQPEAFLAAITEFLAA